MAEQVGVAWRPSAQASKWLFALALSVAVGTVVAAALKGPWPWTLAAACALALLGVVSRRVEQAAKVTDARSALLDATVDTHLGREQLATVADVSLAQLGVHRAIAELAYRARDLDEQMDEAMGEGRAVLLVGHSMAGKSRMAAQFIRTHYAPRLIVIPKPPDGLSRLFAGGGLPAASVVWLDDLERFIVDGSFDTGLLERMLAARTVIVATMRGNAYEGFAPRGDIRPPQRALIERFTVVWVHDTEQERLQLAETMDDPTLKKQVAAHGIGPALGGAFQTLDRFRTGVTQHRVGVALVRAAADWRRIGLEVITRDSLTALAGQYFTGGVQSDESYQEALTWATAVVDTVVQLLRPVPGGFLADDYLLDHLSGPDADPVPNATIREGLAIATPTQALSLGSIAYSALRFDDAATAFQLAVDSGDSQLALPATVTLGSLRLAQGRLDEAATDYQRAVDSDNSEFTPLGEFGLGVVRREQGRLDEAATAFQLAVDSDHGQLAQRAAVRLGDLRLAQGRLDEAATAYQLAVDSDDSEVTQWAAVGLGDVELNQGRFAEAQAAYGRAVDSTDPGVSRRAALGIGNVRWKEGRLDEAATIYQRAVDSDNSKTEPFIEFGLGTLRQEQGRLEEAATAFQRAVDSNDPKHGPFAATGLGIVRWKQGRLDEAAKAYQLAVDSGDSEIAPTAAVCLGDLRREQGRLEEAATAFQLAVDSGDSEIAPTAAVCLGDVRREQGGWKTRNT
jgi:tetratricopeptide (TPR) repeat protein